MSLSSRQIQNITEKSNQFSEALVEVETAVFPWAVRKKLDKRVLQQMKNYTEQWEKFSGMEYEELENIILTFSIMSRIFSRPEIVRSLLKTLRPELTERGITLLKQAIEYPWSITAFRVLEKAGPDIVRFLDYDDGEEYLLYSPGVRDAFESGNNNFYCLLFYNGETLQTYSGIFFIPWADKTDFEYFARRLDRNTFENAGLAEVMTGHPIELVALQVYGDMPIVGHRGENILFCTSSLPLENFSPEMIQVEDPEIYERDGNYRIVLNRDDPMFGPILLWDKKRKRLYLSTKTRNYYQKARKALLPALPFPEIPDTGCSGNMENAVYGILGPDDAMALEQWIGEKNPEETDIPEGPLGEEGTEKLNFLMSRIGMLYNAGEQMDPERLAAETGVDVETVRSMQQEFQKMIERQFPRGKADFFGLNPAVMQKILNKGISQVPDILELHPERAEREALENSEWVSLTAELMQLIHREGKVKLTGKGNLPLKLVHPCHEIYLEFAKRRGNNEYLYNGIRYIRSEEQSAYVSILHALIDLAGFTEESATHIYLSSKGKKVLEEKDILFLYSELFFTMAERYNFFYYTTIKEVPLLYRSLPFQLYLMHKTEGDKIETLDLAGKLLKAFPALVDELDTPHILYTHGNYLAFIIQTIIIDRFCVPFGLLEPVKKNQVQDDQGSAGREKPISADEDPPEQPIFLPPSAYTKTPLFTTVFDWKL